MTPAEVVIDVFGGIREAARAVELAPSTVLRWNQKAGGLIPHEHMRPLLEAAQRRRVRLTIEEIVWGRPDVNRRVITFLEPTPKAKADPFDQMLDGLGSISR